jgi:mannose-1-phosphate guanylyltransferase/phosphomannomutase
LKAMILGAGLGTRLRPLTFELPKPAIPVLGRPLISYNMEFLWKLGTKELVINLHRIPGIIKNKISRWGGFKGKISYIIEPDILGTGGGIKNAGAHFMGEEFFLIANGDTILDFDLKKAIRFHRDKKAVATMVLFPYLDERYTPVYLDENHRLVSIGKKPDTHKFLGFYTGVSLLSPAIIDLLPDGKSCIIENAIIPARKKGLPVSGYLMDGLFFEFGTPSDYLWNTLQYMELRGEGAPPYPEKISVIPPACIASGATFGENVTIGPFVSIEAGAIIEEGATLAHSIVWEKGKVGKDAFIENSIVTPTRVVKCSPKGESRPL